MAKDYTGGDYAAILYASQNGAILGEGHRREVEDIMRLLRDMIPEAPSHQLAQVALGLVAGIGNNDARRSMNGFASDACTSLYMVVARMRRERENQTLSMLAGS